MFMLTASTEQHYSRDRIAIQNQLPTSLVPVGSVVKLDTGTHSKSNQYRSTNQILLVQSKEVGTCIEILYLILKYINNFLTKLPL